MSLTAGEAWAYENLKFHGLSLSGIRTAIAMPEFSFSFDVAQGYPYLIPLKNFFISHGHLDHCAGVPYIISQRAMTSQAPGTFYMPESLVDPLKEIMSIWERIEKHQYKYNFIPLKADDVVTLNHKHYVKAFPTVHRVDSLGYTLFEVNKKLKPEFARLTQEEIVRTKKSGVEVSEEVHTPLVSFTGDTQIEFLHQREWVAQSKVLLVEATYLDERKTREQAKEWGHTHLDEIIDNLDSIQAEKIVLIHISSRYPTHEVYKIIKQKVPPQHRDRIAIFPGR